MFGSNPSDGYVFSAIIILAILGVILGIWKLIEIIFWIIAHVHIVF